MRLRIVKAGSADVLVRPHRLSCIALAAMRAFALPAKTAMNIIKAQLQKELKQAGWPLNAVHRMEVIEDYKGYEIIHISRG